MGVLVELEFSYPYPWEVVNVFMEENKHKAEIDPKVKVEISQNEASGETAYIYTGQTPFWARTFLPPICEWKDVVRVDYKDQVRHEKGGNITQSEKVTIIESSTWSRQMQQDGAEHTVFKRTLQLDVPWIPDRFLSACMRLYRNGSIKQREQEVAAIREAMKKGTASMPRKKKNSSRQAKSVEQEQPKSPAPRRVADGRTRPVAQNTPSSPTHKLSFGVRCTLIVITWLIIFLLIDLFYPWWWDPDASLAVRPEN